MIEQTTYNQLDIKAEVLIAELLERRPDLTLDNLSIHPNGKFNHTIGRDIRTVRKEENQYGDTTTKVIVARPGLYDALPAGLFHKMEIDERDLGVSKKDEVLSSIKRMNKEEKEARKYFAPFDQVINRYRVLIEREERQMLTGFPLDSTHSLFDIIWGDFELTMSNYQKTILFTLLPMAHHIIGNIEYTRSAFEMVIGYPVSMDKEYTHVNLSSKANNSIGTTLLSEDFILGSTSTGIVERYDIRIGPLPSEECEMFFPGGKGMKVVELLADYLLPIEMATHFSYCVESNPIELYQNDDASTSGDNRLGYSICL